MRLCVPLFRLDDAGLAHCTVFAFYYFPPTGEPYFPIPCACSMDESGTINMKEATSYRLARKSERSVNAHEYELKPLKFAYSSDSYPNSAMRFFTTGEQMSGNPMNGPRPFSALIRGRSTGLPTNSCDFQTTCSRRSCGSSSNQIPSKSGGRG